MEDTNHQGDDIDMNSDEDNDNNEEDSEDEPVELDNDIFERLKKNDPAVTILSIDLNCGRSYNDSKSFFHSIDWKIDGGCIANNAQLKKLHVKNTTIDGLTILGKEEQYLPTKQQLQDFFSCIHRNKFITDITISLIRIVTEFGGRLIEGLQGHPSLERLEIKYGAFGSSGCSAVGKVLKHPQSKLKDLHLYNCQLDDQGLSALCDGLLGNSTVKKLSLSGNNISSIGWRALSTILQHPNCKLIELDLSKTGINDESASVLGNALSGLSSLKVLYLSLNHSIGSADWQTLFNQLSQTSVKHLDLTNNYIHDYSLATLANIGTLKSLDISYNNFITPSGWQSFFSTLQRRGTQLVKLDLSNNNIGDVGAISLGSLLSSMNTLKTLKMCCMSDSDDGPDNITPQGWQVLFTTLQDSNLNLVKLHLFKNNIDDEGIQLLMRLVTSMSSLKHLSLSCNYSVTPTGWQALTGCLDNPNLALEELNSNYNNINDDTLIALTNALINNKTLKRLYIEEYSDEQDDFDGEDDLITNRGWDAVSNLLCNRTSIMDTYHSNHTLQDLCDYIPDDDLRSYLDLNRNKDKAEISRQKVLQTHFSGSEDGDTSNMQELLDIELETMATAIAWIGRPTPINWKGTNVSGLSTMFNLLKRVPDLFDSSGQKNPSGVGKRTR